MSTRYRLTDQEINELEYEHRHTSDRRYADRLKAVYLLGSGWPISQVAQALMIDRESVRNHHKRRPDGATTQRCRRQRVRIKYRTTPTADRLPAKPFMPLVPFRVDLQAGCALCSANLADQL